ncbi:MAG TPA: MFS transporter [Planctomycetota bacterium]|nr:MFS transporter [Planctomycetota bacterium]
MTQAPVAAPPGPGRRVVVAWALYDLANTIYSAVVVTAFLPSIFVKSWGSLKPIGITTSLTLLASAIVSPRLGAGVDRTGRARRGLDIATNVCCVFSALLFFAVNWGPVPTLACYAVSLFAYQAALTYYNALLPVVAPPHRRGFVSGLGTGLGYAGIPLALLLGQWIMRATPLGARGAFLLCAVLMTLGTIPLWLYVRDDPAAARRTPSPDAPARTVRDAIAFVRTQPVLLLLLAANFVCADVANTLIQYATLYFEDYVGMPLERAVTLLILLSLTAMVGGLVVGRFADRVPPTRLYAGACAALVVGLVVAAEWPGHPVATAMLIVTGGIGVSTIWSVGRQLVVRVTPPERFGEALGLYGVTTKASIVGTTMFAVLRDHFGYRVAILVEAAVLAGGVLLILALGRRLAREATP